MKEYQPVFIGALIFGAFILVLFAVTGFFSSTGKNSPIEPGDEPKQESVNSQNSETKIIDDRPEDFPAVIYKNNTFTPSAISLGSGKTGTTVDCLIQITNESHEPLVLRLGPYEKNKERGFPYPPITPGESGSIDPRYRGINTAIFYNISKPEESFTATVPQSCFE